MNIQYKIDDNIFNLSVSDESHFTQGEDVILASRKSDIAYNQLWYNKGYVEKDLFSSIEFEDLLTGLTDCIRRIIQDQLGISCDNFTLEQYHKFVTTDEGHFKVVKKTRDLFESDFNFSINKNKEKLGQLLGFELTDIDPDKKFQAHVIVRINRPNSTDFNPPHKDIYEGVDNDGYIPKFINFWIPIAGVTEHSSLPLAPGSHFLPESKIIRTLEGAKMEGNAYRVRMIKEWDKNTNLERSKVKYGQVLIFSSHLIHGLAVNSENDSKRVALEFRLYKKESKTISD